MSHGSRALRRLRRVGVVLAFSIAAAQVAGAVAGDRAPAPAWRVAAPERALERAPTIRETVWTLARQPQGPYDRIRLHRYRGAEQPLATLLYLPGTNMNGVAALHDETHNLWLYLAARGVDVFTIDYRTHAIPPETPTGALGALRGWDTAAFVADVDAAAARARRQSGRRALFVAGFSRGAFLAYAYALAHPRDLAGLVILDGPFKNHAPAGKYDAEQAVKKLQSSGLWATDVSGSHGWESRQRLMESVMADPSAKSQDPKFATVGDLLAHVLQTAWGPGALANPEGGMSKPQVLATLLHGYDRYYPAIQEIEGKSVADHADDPRTHLDDRWGRMRVPILAFASTGFGRTWTQDVLASANGSGSRDVQTHVLQDYGHLDVVVGEKAQAEVYRPILVWLQAH
jgi:alpha-beta hydrolase superfamily lysophospholipase